MTDRRNDWDVGGARWLPQSPAAATFDAELGQIFLRMRLLLGYTLWDMARAVGSEPTVIADLEAGALATLPQWPELGRLINAYAALTGVDAAPIFNRIRRALGQLVSSAPYIDLNGSSVRTDSWTGQAQRQLRGSVTDQPLLPTRPQQRALPAPAMSDITPPVPAKSRTTPVSSRHTQGAAGQAAAAQAASERTSLTRGVRKSTVSIVRGVGRLLGRRAGLLIVVVLPLTVILLARLMPSVLYETISPLPSAVRTPMRHGLDTVVAFIAPLRDGLTWIDVGDPSIRKADKLPERKR